MNRKETIPKAIQGVPAKLDQNMVNALKNTLERAKMGH